MYNLPGFNQKKLSVEAKRVSLHATSTLNRRSKHQMKDTELLSLQVYSFKPQKIDLNDYFFNF